MGERRPEEIREDIAEKRELISDMGDRLEDLIHRILDWREHAKRCPYLALGAAIGAGYLLSRFVGHTPTASERILRAFTETLEDISDSLKNSARGLIVRAAQTEAGKATVPGMTQVIVQIVKRNIGFSAELPPNRRS